jgi:hypothetical protein
METVDLIVVNWQPPTSDAGSTILGYNLFMQIQGSGPYTEIYHGQEDPLTKQFYITQFNSLPLTTGVYEIVVIAYNWVGASAESAILTVTLTPRVDAAASTIVAADGVTTASISASVDAVATIQAVDDTGAPRTGPGDLFFLQISD